MNNSRRKDLLENELSEENINRIEKIIKCSMILCTHFWSILLALNLVALFIVAMKGFFSLSISCILFISFTLMGIKIYQYQEQRWLQFLDFLHEKRNTLLKENQSEQFLNQENKKK